MNDDYPSNQDIQKRYLEDEEKRQEIREITKIGRCTI
jgi:hypothetical protein